LKTVKKLKWLVIDPVYLVPEKGRVRILFADAERNAEVAKRQKCKYVNSIWTRATDDMNKSTGHIVRDIGFPK